MIDPDKKFNTQEEDKNYNRPPVIETDDGIDFGDEDTDYSTIESEEKFIKE